MPRIRTGVSGRHSARVALSGTLTAVCVAALALSFGVQGSDDLETLYAAGTLALPDSITPELIALGDSVYHGTAASGSCSTCHGVAGKGGSRGPALRGRPLHGDGSLESILSVVRRGVNLPRSYNTSMPAFEGTMDRKYLIAVSAYVHALSNPRRRTANQ